MEASNSLGLIANFPEASAIVVLIIGLFLAKLAQRQAGRFMTLMDRLMARYTTSESTLVSPEVTRLSQLAVFWTIVLITVLIVMRILGAGELSQWLDTTLEFVPRVIVGILIIGFGHIFGVLVAFFLSSLSDDLEPTSSGPRLVQGLIFLVGIVLGLQHMLIDITFITQLLLILLFVVGAGLSLAFALGARTYVANLVAQSALNRFNIGDQIRINDIEGRIIEKTNTTIQLESEDGVVSVPCMKFLESTVIQLRDETNE